MIIFCCHLEIYDLSVAHILFTQISNAFNAFDEKNVYPFIYQTFVFVQSLAKVGNLFLKRNSS